MSIIAVLLVTGGFFYGLFALARAIDRRAVFHSAGNVGGVIYALSLAIYCTSWTYYGSVGRAATSGVGFFAVYFGPILMFILGRPLLTRLVKTAKAQHSTSIADFLSAHYGKSRALAGLVTVIAVVGIMPYISLQLKAISSSFDLITHFPLPVVAGALPVKPVWADPVILVVIALGAFCWIFGTRHLDASEQHRGLVTAVAVESIIKLVAFLVAGIFAVWAIQGGLGTLFAQAATDPRTIPLMDWQGALGSTSWWSITLASAAAMLCLPRQFQVLVVENVDLRHLRTSFWLFPVYLIAINLFVLPIALVGVMTFGDSGVDADTFVISLPILGNHLSVALIVFVGGLSAASAMVLMETIALSTMISNDLVMPVLLRRLMAADARTVSRLVKRIRRAAIAAVLVLAYGYMQLTGGSYALVNIGLTSFAAAAQFAPAIVGALYWKGGTKEGVLAGLAAGFAVWCYTLLLPSFAHSGWLPPAFGAEGLFGGGLLAPYALFGIGGMDHFTHGLLWSLLANVSCFVLVSVLASSRRDGGAAPIATPAGGATDGTATVATLSSVVGRFAGWVRTEQAFAAFANAAGKPLDPRLPADAEMIAFAERWLAGAIGAASARQVIAGAVGNGHAPVDAMKLLLASPAIDASRGILVDALDHLGQGVVVIDGNFQLSACNRKFQAMFGLPDDLVVHGAPLDAIIRHNAIRGEYGPCDVEAKVAERMRLVRTRKAHRIERERPDGTVLEVTGNPLPNGGFITSYVDATRRHRAEQELRRSYEVLEQRVMERTKELFQEVEERARTEAALRASHGRLKGITDNLFEGVLVADGDGMVLFANPSARCYLAAKNDFPPEGRPLDSVFRLCHDGAPQSFTDGPFAKVVRGGGGYSEDDAFFVTADGRQLNVAYACSPLRDESGHGSAIISFKSIDALKAAQTEAAGASRLAAVGQLAAGIAHEINTPAQYVGDNLNFLAQAFGDLQPVFGAARELAEAARSTQSLAPLCDRFQAAAEEADLDFLLGEIPTAIGQSRDGIGQVSRIVLSMKEFSHPGSRAKTLTDVNRALENTLVVTRNEWKHVATVETEFDPALPPLHCYAGELNQVFLNIVINAVHAIVDSGKPQPGTIRISTRPSGQGVEIRFEDSGRGVPLAIRDRIFDPFFTTKEVGKGTGQGLAISHDVVVAKHGGRIEVAGEEGQGAIITVWLPQGGVA